MTIQAGQKDEHGPKEGKVSPGIRCTAHSQKVDIHVEKEAAARDKGQLQETPRKELDPHPEDSWQAVFPLGPSTLLSPLAFSHFTPLYLPTRLPDVCASLGDTDGKQRWYLARGCQVNN